MSPISHYTIVVIGEDVESQLAPYDEDISVAPYRRYWDSDDIERWEGILSEGDGERPVLTPAGSKATVEEIAAVYNERYGEDGEVFVDDGGIYEMTTYNAPWRRYIWCPGYSPTNHGEGRKADQSSWDEVLRALRADEALGGVPESDEESRRKVHLLLRLHEDSEQGPDAGAADGVALEHAEGEVRHHGRSVRRPTGSASGGLRNLPEATRAEASSGRSLPHDREGARIALLQLQRDLGSRAGELRLASCGDQLPHPPHELRQLTVGGAKWDWYQVGGRWQGFFAVRHWSSDCQAWNTIHDEAVARGLQPEEAVAEADRYRDARETLTPTLGEASWANESGPEPDGADALLRGDVDVEAMRAAAGTRAGEWWDRMHAVVGDLPTAEPWDDFVFRIKEKELVIEQGRERYHAQPRLKAVAEHDQAEQAKKENGQPLVGWGGDGVDEYQRYTREQYVERARAAAFAPFAYVYRGEWVEAGRMGWFGMSTETELSRTEYHARFNELFDSLPADTPLALVDAHI